MPSEDIIHRLASELDRSSGEPLARQIVEYIWIEVVEGRLETGARMPTVRELAIQLGVSPRAVDWAYSELGRLGVTAPHAGEGTVVSLTPPPDAERKRRQALHALSREAADGARSLGFKVEDLVEALEEFRLDDREGTSEGRES
jgi:GntR family transcriptional regulator